MSNIDLYLNEYLQKCCDYIGFDKNSTSRLEIIIAKKHAIIYHVYHCFDFFITENLNKKIADFFSIDRTNIYNALNKINFLIK